MRRFKQLLIVAFLAVAAAIVVRYYRHQRDRAIALPVVSELGGKVGSLPFEPFGTEYVISFHDRWLSHAELERLVAIKPLSKRNSVAIYFENSGLTPDDLLFVKRLLPKARVNLADPPVGGEHAILRTLRSRYRSSVHVATWTLEKNGISIPQSVPFDVPYEDALPRIRAIYAHVQSLPAEKLTDLDESLAENWQLYSPIWRDAEWD